MRSVNSHFSMILSVFVLLFSFQCTTIINTIVQTYALKITDDYSIVLVASSELKEEVLQKEIPSLKSLSEISSKKILDRLKNDMSSKNLSLLQVALPKFYSLKLSELPETKEMERIKQVLQNNRAITRIETFAKTHEKMFKMFRLLQKIVYVFSVFIALIAVLLIFKQIRIWTYEHSRRMSIMSLFGASFFMKSAMLYRMTLVDSLLSAMGVCALFWYLPRNQWVQDFATEFDIVIPPFHLLNDGGILVGAATLFALLSVTMVSQKTGRL